MIPSRSSSINGSGSGVTVFGHHFLGSSSKGFFSITFSATASRKKALSVAFMTFLAVLTARCFLWVRSASNLNGTSDEQCGPGEPTFCLAQESKRVDSHTQHSARCEAARSNTERFWWRSRFKICRRCRSRIRRWVSVCHVCGAEQQ
jgi:hypothetical protein